MKRLIEELKRLKNEAYEFPKTDYNDGWISAIETVEEIVEEDGDKYRWHDLRKNPEDLPENGYYDTCSYWHESFQNNRAFYDSDRKKWFFHPDNNTGKPWIEDLTIIAWREIEPFEEDEE